MLALDEKIKAIANELYEQRSLLVMGRGFHYATCLEGALVSWEWQCWLSLYVIYCNHLLNLFIVCYLFVENQRDHLHALRGHPGWGAETRSSGTY